MPSARIAAALLAAGFALSSCSTDSQAEPSDTNEVTTPSSSAAASTVTTDPPTSVSPPTTAAPTTSPPTTSPYDPEVHAACATLTSGEYTQRVAALATAPREQVALLCGEALTWTEQAAATAAAAQAAYDLHGTWVDNYAVTDCQPSGATLTVTNPHPVAMAMWGVVWGITDDPLDLAHPQPVHIARIEPGATATTTLTTEGNGWADGCEDAYQFYVAPEGDPAPDAGLPELPATGPQSNDDPAVFYPVLAEAWRDAEHSLDQVALFGYGDVHDLGVPGVRTHWTADGPSTVERPNRLLVCGVVLDAGPGLVMISMREEWGSVSVGGVDQGPRSVLELGMFRKGSDGNWRWLGYDTPIHYDPIGTPC